MPAVLAFGGNKSQTDFFFSFMFHLQTTRQQTSVFTPMLIKVNYLVVRGHWWKTCGLLGLRYIRKFKTSRCIQHQLMACVCFPVRFQSIFFQRMFELLLLCQDKCLPIPPRLSPLSSHHSTFMGAEHFFLLLLETSPILPAT